MFSTAVSNNHNCNSLHTLAYEFLFHMNSSFIWIPLSYEFLFHVNSSSSVIWIPFSYEFLYHKLLAKTTTSSRFSAISWIISTLFAQLNKLHTHRENYFTFCELFHNILYQVNLQFLFPQQKKLWREILFKSMAWQSTETNLFFTNSTNPWGI